MQPDTNNLPKTHEVKNRDLYIGYKPGYKDTWSIFKKEVDLALKKLKNGEIRSITLHLHQESDI